MNIFKLEKFVNYYITLFAMFIRVLYYIVLIFLLLARFINTCFVSVREMINNIQLERKKREREFYVEDLEKKLYIN